jgi:hypothetical protein
MAPSTVGIILRSSRGQVRQCTTAADAVPCVRRETITTTWCRKSTADMPLVAANGACEARYLRGHTAVILAALEQRDRETTPAHASRWRPCLRGTANLCAGA